MTTPGSGKVPAFRRKKIGAIPEAIPKDSLLGDLAVKMQRPSVVIPSKRSSSEAKDAKKLLLDTLEDKLKLRHLPTTDTSEFARRQAIIAESLKYLRFFQFSVTSLYTGGEELWKKAKETLTLNSAEITPEKLAETKRILGETLARYKDMGMKLESLNLLRPTTLEQKALGEVDATETAAAAKETEDLIRGSKVEIEKRIAVISHCLELLEDPSPTVVEQCAELLQKQESTRTFASTPAETAPAKKPGGDIIDELQEQLDITRKRQESFGELATQLFGAELPTTTEAKLFAAIPTAEPDFSNLDFSSPDPILRARKQIDETQKALDEYVQFANKNEDILVYLNSGDPQSAPKIARASQLANIQGKLEGSKLLLQFHEKYAAIVAASEKLAENPSEEDLEKLHQEIDTYRKEYLSLARGESVTTSVANALKPGEKISVPHPDIQPRWQEYAKVLDGIETKIVTRKLQQIAQKLSEEKIALLKEYETLQSTSPQNPNEHLKSLEAYHDKVSKYLTKIPSEYRQYLDPDTLTNIEELEKKERQTKLQEVIVRQRLIIELTDKLDTASEQEISNLKDLLDKNQSLIDEFIVENQAPTTTIVATEKTILSLSTLKEQLTNINTYQALISEKKKRQKQLQAFIDSPIKNSDDITIQSIRNSITRNENILTRAKLLLDADKYKTYETSILLEIADLKTAELRLINITTYRTLQQEFAKQTETAIKISSTTSRLELEEQEKKLDSLIAKYESTLQSLQDPVLTELTQQAEGELATLKQLQEQLQAHKKELLAKEAVASSPQALSTTPDPTIPGQPLSQQTEVANISVESLTAIRNAIKDTREKYEKLWDEGKSEAYFLQEQMQDLESRAKQLLEPILTNSTSQVPSINDETKKESLLLIEELTKLQIDKQQLQITTTAFQYEGKIKLLPQGETADTETAKKITQLQKEAQDILAQYEQAFTKPPTTTPEQLYSTVKTGLQKVEDEIKELFEKIDTQTTYSSSTIDQLTTLSSTLSDLSTNRQELEIYEQSYQLKRTIDPLADAQPTTTITGPPATVGPEVLPVVVDLHKGEEQKKVVETQPEAEKEVLPESPGEKSPVVGTKGEEKHTGAGKEVVKTPQEALPADDTSKEVVGTQQVVVPPASQKEAHLAAELPKEKSPAVTVGDVSTVESLVGKYKKEKEALPDRQFPGKIKASDQVKMAGELEKTLQDYKSGSLSPEKTADNIIKIMRENRARHKTAVFAMASTFNFRVLQSTPPELQKIICTKLGIEGNVPILKSITHSNLNKILDKTADVLPRGEKVVHRGLPR